MVVKEGSSYFISLINSDKLQIELDKNVSRARKKLTELHFRRIAIYASNRFTGCGKYGTYDYVD